MTKHLRSVLIAGALSCAPVMAQSVNAGDPAVAASFSYFNANKDILGLRDPIQELKPRALRRDAAGTAHVRFQQYFGGLRVFEGEAIAHVDRTGAVRITSGLRGHLNLALLPSVPQNAAVATAVAAIGPKGAYATPLVALEILPAGPRSPIDLLVWHVRIHVENEVDPVAQWDVFIDARNGGVLWRFNSLETATGPVTVTGKTMWSGDVTLDALNILKNYLFDSTLGHGMFTTDMNNLKSGTGTVVSGWSTIFGDGNKNNSDRATAAADAHFGLMSTLEYYLNNHGRAGVDGNGRLVYSRVHYGVLYENAFWNDFCFCMTYGDGGFRFYPLTSLDVAGHEVSHGVMATEANLTYIGESGGLNESNSDIFGTMVEYYVNSPVDVPDYWIGERVARANWTNGGTTYVQQTALRYMDDPHKDGTSPACWFNGIGLMNVHYSSGPNNHMFYLLAEGGTSMCNGQVVAGIGRTDAAKIWYKAVTDYMLPSTNYRAARVACLNAATELFGAESTQYNAVNSAYAAINVN